jgi:hypothetical protein
MPDSAWKQKQHSREARSLDRLVLASIQIVKTKAEAYQRDAQSVEISSAY